MNNQCIVDPTVPQTIKTVLDAKTFITSLYNEGYLYHFDDDAADCLRDAFGVTPEIIKNIQANVDQLFNVDYTGSDYEDAFDIALEVSKDD